MRVVHNCIPCMLNQVVTVSNLAKGKKFNKDKLMKEVLAYLSEEDYDKCVPEVFGSVWEKITEYTGIEDPYREDKTYYNKAVYDNLDKVENVILNSDDKLYTALKVACSGNLIDFGSNHKFSLDILMKGVKNIVNTDLVMDDHEMLFKKLETAKTLLYVGDNCGEIALDKLFIKYLRLSYPNLKIYFGVRGGAVLNDVTIVDAEEVKMSEVAEVISSGHISPGLVLNKIGKECLDIYNKADVVIAKGQGNLEALSDENCEKVYFMLMLKCKFLADLVKVPQMSIVCKNGKGLGM